MEQSFRVDLYCSLERRIINIVILLISVCSLLYGTFYLIVNVINGVTLYELFYKSYEVSLFFNDLSVVYGTIDFIKYIFSFVFYILTLIISLLSLINNKMIVDNEYIIIHFAPRYLKRYVNLKSIIDIVHIQGDEISLAQRIKNFDFSKKHLYKITTKYDETIIVPCANESGLERLKTIIDTKTQGTQRDGSSVSN